MHKDAFGLIFPSHLYLESINAKYQNKYSTYCRQKDSVYRYVKEHYQYKLPYIYGNLIFGKGFASSSALAYLYLYRYQANDELKQNIDKIDFKIHGFHPSGVDSSYCLYKKSGAFHNGEWYKLDFKIPKYSIIIIEEKSKFVLLETMSKVHSEKRILSSISNSIYNLALKTKAINSNYLMEYCNILHRLKIYAPTATNVIEFCLKSGIAAKCIGGLSNKAIIIFWPAFYDKDDINNFLKRLSILIHESFSAFV